MEQCLSFLMKNASTMTSRSGKSYLLFTKEATHSLYHHHHHYILHHIFSYYYKFNQSDLQSVNGTLTLTDDQGNSFPCDFIKVSLIHDDMDQQKAVATNKNGNYYIGYHKRSPIENFSVLLKEYPDFKNFSFLPNIKLSFTEDTTIDNNEYSFIESSIVTL